MDPNELIQRYLHGEATDAEVAELDRLLASDPALRRRLIVEAGIDAGLCEIAREQASQPQVPVRRRSVSLSRRPLVAAAGIVVVALLGSLLFFSSGTASAAAVVQRALKAHAALLDRCYRLEVRGAARAVVLRSQESLLWTRGDRFWNQIEADGGTAAWGRGPAGGVWFALSPNEGARMAADEVPEALAQACELRSLELESLLRTILADFDLRREPSSDGREVIHAERRAGRMSKYRSALLEADAESGVLRRVELHREHQGRVVATISASLVESRLQDEASYTLEGHLDAGAAIYDRQNGRGYRGRLLMNFLELIRVRPLP